MNVQFIPKYLTGQGKSAGLAVKTGTALGQSDYGIFSDPAWVAAELE
jgi:hypothetical protein